MAWRSGLFSAFGASGHCRSEGAGVGGKVAPPSGSAFMRLNSLQVPVAPAAFGEVCISALNSWKQLGAEQKAGQVEGLAFFASRGLRWHFASLEAAVPSCALLQALASSSPPCAERVVAAGGPLVMLDAAKVRQVPSGCQFSPTNCPPEMRQLPAVTTPLFRRVHAAHFASVPSPRRPTQVPFQSRCLSVSFVAS